jgi:4-methylaminobutanoate oxidase (formaldehyde-forming)
MGLTEDLDNLFHCCGFSAGIAAAGGAGEAMANWIVDNDPGLDLWPFDVRRFGAPHNVPAVLELLSIGSYGHYYDIAYPNRPPLPPRGQRRSAVHDRLRDRGAVFACRFGYEQAEWFATGGADRTETPTFGRGAAWPFVEAEHRAVREAAGVVDRSSMAKFRIRGRNALATLQKVAGADLDTALGTVVHTPLLNVRGGIEADVTVTRLGGDEFYLVTGAGFGRHDVAFLLQNTPDDGSVTVDDVTSAFGVLTVCGPLSRQLLESLSGADFGEAFSSMAARYVDLGWAPALALRVTYTGELGWELHIPTEYVADAYDKLVVAGGAFGLRDVGHRALESLRLERQHLAWSVDIKADTNPYEAGVGFLVDPTRPALLAGPALRALVQNGPQRKLCWFSTAADVTMHGGELLAHPASGFQVGVASAGFGHTVQRTIFSAYLPVEIASETRFEVEVLNRRFPATRHDAPLYNPA